MNMKFEVYDDAGGKPRWRLKASNGQTIASSGESFASTSSATAAAQNFKDKAKLWNYEIYPDAGGSYRWRAKSSNGQNVGSSGESFASKSNAERAAENVRDNAGSATGP
jgi:uncharacterized protein YegP (UPF0339 family)